MSSFVEHAASIRQGVARLLSTLSENAPKHIDDIWCSCRKLSRNWLVVSTSWERTYEVFTRQASSRVGYSSARIWEAWKCRRDLYVCSLQPLVRLEVCRYLFLCQTYIIYLIFSNLFVLLTCDVCSVSAPVTRLLVPWTWSRLTYKPKALVSAASSVLSTVILSSTLTPRYVHYLILENFTVSNYIPHLYNSGQVHGICLLSMYSLENP